MYFRLVLAFFSLICFAREVQLNDPAFNYKLKLEKNKISYQSDLGSFSLEKSECFNKEFDEIQISINRLIDKKVLTKKGLKKGIEIVVDEKVFRVIKQSKTHLELRMVPAELRRLVMMKSSMCKKKLAN